MLTTILSVCKLAIPLPNIEVVTSLLISYALILPTRQVISIVYGFILLEIFIWGFAIWWVAIYVVYWSFLCLTIKFTTKFISNKLATKSFSNIQLIYVTYSKKYLFNTKIILSVLIGIIFTVLFGAFSTLIETIIFREFPTQKFWIYYSLRYVSGIPFFAIHIISNIVVLPLLVPLFTNALQNLLFPNIQEFQ